MPGPAGASRADIIALLAEGHSDRYIGRTVHTHTMRVAAIRRELDLPAYQPKPALTIEERWAVHAQPVPGGHMRWTGSHRDGMPSLVYRQRGYSARRIAFQIANGRQPVGRVLPGCDYGWCVAPQCATDEPARRADALYDRIFRRAA